MQNRGSYKNGNRMSGCEIPFEDGSRLQLRPKAFLKSFPIRRNRMMPLRSQGMKETMGVELRHVDVLEITSRIAESPCIR